MRAGVVNGRFEFTNVAPGDYVLGANIAGFVRVAEAMEALGVI